ncbi:ribonuclease HIII [Mycoplasma gypis]|nr:ribonuclease HIII [[Mycoplasma] gypis]
MNSDFIGCDETGVGDYFSPIVFVAAYIPKQNYQKILDLGVRDSKKISDTKIIKIAQELQKLVFYSKTILTQKGNNRLTNFLNVNEIKLLYHYKNINNLQQKIDKQAFIDQFSTLNSIKGYESKLLKLNLDFQIPRHNTLFETKAEDKILSVGVASILARYFLLDYMQQQNAKYGVQFPLGASSKIIDFGKELIKKFGAEVLDEVAKTNFKTTSQIIEPKI